MTRTVFNGKQVVADIEARLKARVEAVKKKRGYAPGLLSIVAGNDPASLQFIGIKEKRARALGMSFERKHYPATFAPKELVKFINSQNENTRIDGIIVQLPLPEQFDRHLTLKAIHPYKDVDGLHPKNLGLLIEGQPKFMPPAVLAVAECLRRGEVDLVGKHVVMVGAGLLVGKPVGLWLMHQGATVTFCHHQTDDIGQFTQIADIIVSSTGQVHLMDASMVKEGSVLVDFGGTLVNGKLQGEFTQDCYDKASLYTPVPGGIGPLTVTFLLQNTIESAEFSL